MNSRAGVIAPRLGYRSIVDRVTAETAAGTIKSSRFADEQIRSLVRQVFSPGWPRPVRQAVFSSIEANEAVGELCSQVGRELAAQVSGAVCIVETERESTDEECGRMAGLPLTATYCPGEIRQSSRQIGSNLWLTASEVFYQGSPEIMSVSWLRTRLAQLRLDFEYALLQARPAGLCSDSALLGSLTGGIILVLQADLTRRGPAQKASEMLRAANAHLLGTVLSNRRFPIPERLYRRL